MGKVYKNSLMGILIKEFMLWGSHKDMVNIIGQMAVFLKATFKMEFDKEKDCGKKEMETLKNMKVTTSKIKNKGMVFIHGKMGVFTRAILWMMWNKGMGKCIGQMEEFIKGNGSIINKLEKITIPIIIINNLNNIKVNNGQIYSTIFKVWKRRLMITKLIKQKSNLLGNKLN